MATERTASTTPIAAKVIAEMKRHSRGNIIRLKDIIGGRAMAEELQRAVVDAKGLAGMHPAHAVYLRPEPDVRDVGDAYLAGAVGSHCGPRFRSRGHLHAGRAADEPTDRVVLLLVGLLRCLFPTNRQRDHRYDDRTRAQRNHQLATLDHSTFCCAYSRIA
jgi:hypothetical protein